jgi:hypothetical protein
MAGIKSTVLNPLTSLAKRVLLVFVIFLVSFLSQTSGFNYFYFKCTFCFFFLLQVNRIPKCICLILIVITCDDVGTWFMF